MRKVPRGTFECVTEFVDGPNFDGRNVEMHFHDVLTDEYTSYNVSLPSSWHCAAERPGASPSMLRTCLPA